MNAAKWGYYPFKFITYSKSSSFKEHKIIRISFRRFCQLLAALEQQQQYQQSNSNFMNTHSGHFMVLHVPFFIFRCYTVETTDLLGCQKLTETVWVKSSQNCDGSLWHELGGLIQISSEEMSMAQKNHSPEIKTPVLSDDGWKSFSFLKQG